MNDTLTAGAAAGVMLVSLVIGLLFIALEIIVFWRIFTKAGVEGWKCLIPVYNLIVIAQIAGMNPWLLLLMLIPCVGPFVAIYMYYKLGCKFGSKVYGILCAIPFTMWIALLMIAFSSSIEYNFED